MHNVTTDFIAAMRDTGRRFDAQIIVGNTVYDLSAIESLTVNIDGGFPSTAMQSITATIRGDFSAPDGVIDNVKIGVETNNGFEYINYGKFFLSNDDGTGYNTDTDMWTITAYDALVNTMTEIPTIEDEDGNDTTDDAVDAEKTISVQELLNGAIQILNSVGVTSTLPDMTAYTVIASAYSSQTYRDLLEDIAEVLCGIIRVKDNKLILIRPGEVESTKIELQDLTSASINDSVLISGIQLNGTAGIQKILSNEASTEVQVTISDNPIVEYLVDNSSTAAEQLNAVKSNYTAYLLGKTLTSVTANTTGVAWYDIGDFVNITNKKDNLDYPFVFTKSAITLSNGLTQSVESSLTSKTEEITYTADSKLKGVTSEINRLSSGLQLKVSKGDVVSEINQSPEKISLKANRIEIDSDKFKLSADGKIVAESGTIAGFDLTNTAFEKNFAVGGVNYKFKITSDTTSETATYLISLAEQNAGEYSFAVDTQGNVECGDLYGGAISCTKVNLSSSINDATEQSILTARNGSGHTYIGYARKLDGKNTIIAGGTVQFQPQNGTNCSLFKESSSNARTIFRPDTNGGAYLGSGSYKWHSIYCTDGAFNGSDRKLKENIADLDAESNKTFVLSLRPVSYKLKTGEGKRTHNGFIAQEVREAAENTVGDIAAYQASVIDGDEEKYFDPAVPDEKLLWQLNYSELIAPIVKLVQSQQQEIEQLKKEVEKLK
uniref:tail fiber domain-containing protein n=1 Tax=Phocaeicola dorei TaxID=357276 RepID=UPI004026D62F